MAAELDGVTTEELWKELKKAKLSLMLHFLKLDKPEKVKECLVDLVEDVWNNKVSDSEEIRRRYQKCLTK